jgi:hypothetical protein
MEFIKEIFPFLLGIIFIPPIVIVALPNNWSGRTRFVATFVIAVIVGFIGSAIVGEQFGELEERVVALILDSSTAYAGSQIGYWLFWKALLEPRLHGTAS